MWAWASNISKTLRFNCRRDVAFDMTEKTLPIRSLERKKREAAALKANLKRRKEQAKVKPESKGNENVER